MDKWYKRKGKEKEFEVAIREGINCNGNKENGTSRKMTQTGRGKQKRKI